MKIQIMRHQFVKSVPEALDEGTVYVSVEHATVIHKCCCGCGEEIVTPLSPTDWQLTYDGQSVSLYPSIGNWSNACQSHYWIKRNHVHWAERWSKEKIEAGRHAESVQRNDYYFDMDNAEPDVRDEVAIPQCDEPDSWWTRFVRLITRR
jgi:hypothetical protein